MNQLSQAGGAATLTSFTPPRRTARYPFAAKVALSEAGANARVLGLTTDLSEGGCGVRAQELFERGTTVQLEITKDGESLRVAATVAYGLPPNIMGLSFKEMDASQRSVLLNWIDKAIPTLRRSIPEEEIRCPAPEDMPASFERGKSR